MKTLKIYIITGILFVLITGTLAHFVYEWSGSNFLLGFFFPVSESTWEHMKLSFFPMLVYAIFMNRNLKDSAPCVTSALLSGILLSTFAIPVLFYTYTGILGRDFLPLDIATFILSVILGFLAIYRLTLSCRMQEHTDILQVLVWILFLCFILFTYFPPDIGIFADPVHT